MKIGLIAMSGIRACDEELLRLGLTLPGFVERSKTIASLPSLGILTLAGMTPKPHSCHYLEVADLRHLGELPSFDLVAISSYSAQIGEAYALADRYREARIPVVMGGLHVSSLPSEAAEHCDAVVIGEGEAAWSRVLEDAASGRLAPAYVTDGQFPLSQSPMPAFEMLDLTKYNRLTVQTSRGCPWLCEFCASSVLLSKRYKQKPVERVLAEIDRICGLWRRPFLEFADDNAFVNAAWWKELLGELSSRRVRWFAETDVSVSEDEHLLELMRESGCAEVLIGLESPVASGLGRLELRRDWKYQKWPEYRAAIRRIQSHGVRVNGCFIIGLDGQTVDVFDAIEEFARDTELFDVQITIQTPFPGTPLHRRLASEDRLLEPNLWERCTLFDINYRPSPMSIDELRTGFHQLAARLYSDESTRRRRENFNRKYLRRERESTR